MWASLTSYIHLFYSLCRSFWLGASAITVEAFRLIVSIKLEHFDSSGSIPWEQRLPVGLSDLLHLTDL